MSEAVLDALRDLLTTDPEFVAEMRALRLGLNHAEAVPQVLEDNRRFEQLDQRQMPCWVMEAGDSQGASSANDFADPNGLVINSTQQDWLDETVLALVWLDQHFGNALRVRRRVHQAVVRLLLRNPGLGGAEFAYVANVVNDRNARHPTHWTALTVRAHTTIYRDSP